MEQNEIPPKQLHEIRSRATYLGLLLFFLKQDWEWNFCPDGPRGSLPAGARMDQVMHITDLLHCSTTFQARPLIQEAAMRAGNVQLPDAIQQVPPDWSGETEVFLLFVFGKSW